ncbi:MAG: hypothetical protein PQ612_05860 [Rickettsiales bacterium]|nr:hypothetical protein [Pseudomonadota bacterium]MDA0966848.1 hypothetical protein [Pseudomonadota bacterium]MDG4543523.1 hypothetical protein [Rickettsiales bacterium]MDG4545671.1 hypothetical protein [Rickettsiales bacterium]MDG4547556.1 hypothetical protein [Rickettsiales bacterium]
MTAVAIAAIFGLVFTFGSAKCEKDGYNDIKKCTAKYQQYNKK